MTNPLQSLRQALVAHLLADTQIQSVLQGNFVYWGMPVNARLPAIVIEQAQERIADGDTPPAFQIFLTFRILDQGMSSVGIANLSSRLQTLVPQLNMPGFDIANATLEDLRAQALTSDEAQLILQRWRFVLDPMP